MEHEFAANCDQVMCAQRGAEAQPVTLGARWLIRVLLKLTVRAPRLIGL
jgi:hypothetical protein